MKYIVEAAHILPLSMLVAYIAGIEILMFAGLEVTKNVLI